jgi:parvulin-like peptidyl-prolyl isomerase
MLLSFVALACERRPKPLAEVAGRAITMTELERAVQEVAGRPASQVAPELVAQVFSDLLEEEVLLAAGAPEDRTLQGSQRTRRARELLAKLCPPPPPPSEEEISQALAQEGDSDGQEHLFLRQLILPSEGQAREVRERLLKGEDFFALSRELSRAPNAANGGALGWVQRGQLPPEFEGALAGVPAGGFSQPVKSSAGWHVFFVEKKQQGSDPSRRQQVAQKLSSERVEAARHRCLLELARRVEVRLHCEKAPFPCRNPFQEAP